MSQATKFFDRWLQCSYRSFVTKENTNNTFCHQCFENLCKLLIADKNK